MAYKIKNNNKIYSIIFIMLGIISLLVVMFLSKKKPSTAIPCTMFSFATFIIGFKLNKSSKKVDKENKRLANMDLLGYGRLIHEEGLNIPKKSNCELKVMQDKLIISGGGAEFSLKTSQIRVAESKTDVEIEKIVSSSASKGIAGAILFGTVGAIIGSSTKTKSNRRFNYYLIINYLNSNGELSPLIFSGYSQSDTNKIAGKLKTLIKDNPIEKINL